MTVGAKYFGKCLIDTIKSGNSRGELCVVNYNGWLNQVNSTEDSYRWGELRLVSEGTDGGVQPDLERGTRRRMMGANRTASYLPVVVVGDKAEKKKIGGFGGNLLIDVNNGILAEGHQGRYLENVLRNKNMVPVDKKRNI